MYGYFGDTTLDCFILFRPQKSARSKHEKEMSVSVPRTGLMLAAGLAAVLTLPANAAPGGDWQSLFDGKTLGGWKITDFAGHGKVDIEN